MAIAQTLILRPRIILMDEPFGALDPMTRMNMQDLLLDLWRQTQATVFFVTHSIEEAVFLSDRIYVVSNSPGTILRELAVEPSDRPSKEMQTASPISGNRLLPARPDQPARGEPASRNVGGMKRQAPLEPKADAQRRKVFDVGLGKYLKKAFSEPLEPAGFPGRTGFACFPGHPDVFIPLVMAGEAAYLGVLGTHPKFQRYVDAQEAKAGREQGSVLAAAAFDRMIKALPPRQLHRFGHSAKLRLAAAASPSRCVPPRSPRDGTDPCPWRTCNSPAGPAALDPSSPALHAAHARPLLREHQPGADRIRDRSGWKQRLARMPATDAADASPRRVIRKALEDNLETCRGRLANLQKARENSELVEAEIERLENKIRSITEMAINRQDPQFVSGQVDLVADEPDAHRGDHERAPVCHRARSDR